MSVRQHLAATASRPGPNGIVTKALVCAAICSRKPTMLISIRGHLTGEHAHHPPCPQERLDNQYGHVHCNTTLLYAHNLLQQSSCQPFYALNGRGTSATLRSSSVSCFSAVDCVDIDDSLYTVMAATIFAALYHDMVSEIWPAKIEAG